MSSPEQGGCVSRYDGQYDRHGGRTSLPQSFNTRHT